MSIPIRARLGDATPAAVLPRSQSAPKPGVSDLGAVAAAWLTDARLRVCSPGARLLWLDLLPVLHGAERPGRLAFGGVALPVEWIADKVGVTPDEAGRHLAELVTAGVAVVAEGGVITCPLTVAAAQGAELPADSPGAELPCLVPFPSWPESAAQRKSHRCSVAGKRSADVRWGRHGVDGVTPSTPCATPSQLEEPRQNAGNSPGPTPSTPSTPKSRGVCVSSSFSSGETKDTHTRGGGVGEGRAGETIGSWPPGFGAFWSVYPLKSHEEDAVKQWKKLDPSPELQAEILAAIKRLERSDQWRRKVYTRPDRWLKAKGWRDDLPEVKPAPSLFMTAEEQECAKNHADLVRDYQARR